MEQLIDRKEDELVCLSAQLRDKEQLLLDADR